MIGSYKYGCGLPYLPKRTLTLATHAAVTRAAESDPYAKIAASRRSWHMSFANHRLPRNPPPRRMFIVHH
jgi:hypothetical protein